MSASISARIGPDRPDRERIRVACPTTTWEDILKPTLKSLRAPEGELELRYFDPIAGVYVPMLGWTVMTEHNMVHADTPFTGRFAVIPEPSRWMMLSAGLCLLAGLYRLRHCT
jgi:hypothetical protein